LLHRYETQEARAIKPNERSGMGTVWTLDDSERLKKARGSERRRWAACCLVGEGLENTCQVTYDKIVAGVEIRIDDMNRMYGMLAGPLILTHCI
jgi:hypothetical protein